MKPRRVFVTLELVSNETLVSLRSKYRWTSLKTTCLQASANVAQKIKKGHSRK